MPFERFTEFRPSQALLPVTMPLKRQHDATLTRNFRHESVGGRSIELRLLEPPKGGQCINHRWS